MATFRVGDTPPRFDGEVDILAFAAGMDGHDHEPCRACVELAHRLAALEAESGAHRGDSAAPGGGC